MGNALFYNKQISTLSVRTNIGLEKFTLQLSGLVCSEAEIGLWQESEIGKLKSFYQELISKLLPVQVKQQIKEVFDFIEDHQEIDRLQLENISRIKELYLLAAASENNIFQFQCLLRNNSADVSDAYGITALHIASEHGYEVITKQLIDAGTALIKLATRVSQRFIWPHKRGVL